MSKNDVAWEKLFQKHSILDRVNQDNIFEIRAEEINVFRESRLMTKFDHVANLPKLFADNDLNILPITRGSYVIGRFAAYQPVKYNPTVESTIIPFPSHLESIDYTNIYSESAALNCAFVTDILRDIAGESVLPTVSGRMSTSRFQFDINARPQNFNLTVANSQCEIDGGYEGENVLLLIEAKNYSVDDFLIRQLYYPYRLWQGKISKIVVPVFLTFSNDTFSFFKYEFADPNNYNSLNLLEQRNYIITSQTISLKDIRQILDEIQVVPDDLAIPFPQADSFERIVDLLGLLYTDEDGILDNEFITGNYDFDKRQTAYYVAAGRYVGLIHSDGRGKYSLTDQGRKIMALPYYQKYLALVRAILTHEVFNRALRLYLEQLSPLNRDQVVEIMKDSTTNIIGDSTYNRRAQSVIKWIEWIIDLDN